MWNKKSQQAIQKHTIFIYDADHGYILDEIMRCGHIEY